MAEAIGLASSLVALAGFAFQASKSLYQVLESFKSTKGLFVNFAMNLML
jgi:hypothetical protein